MHVQCLHGSNYAKEFSNKEKKLKYKMYQNVNFTYTFSLFTSDIRQKNETRCNEICFLLGQEKNQRSVVKGTRFRFQMLFAVNEHHIPEFLLQESSFEL